jgi:hypothetical protein
MKKSALIFLLALFALPVLAQKTGFSGGGGNVDEIKDIDRL